MKEPTQLTSVAASLADKPSLESSSAPWPEWFTVNEACEFARCSRPLIYSWMARGWIRNVSLRERGKLKGYRRISADSLRDFLNNHATGGTSIEK